MTAVIYARFSSHNQTEQSIEGQLDACYDYAKRNKISIVGEYIDRAMSGTSAEKRESFQQMITDSSKKLFDTVLVYQLDRFARNRYDSATYKAKLKKNGVRVVSVRENISEDASGILMESVLEGMAEYYSAELSQKVQRGMNLSAEKCQSLGGKPPLGYRVDDDKKFQIDPQTAAFVQQIFEDYVAGHTIKHITDKLNMLGLKTSQGNAFNKNSLYTLLQNKKYIGIYVYRGQETPNAVPRILTDELFYQVQEKMGKNKIAPARARAKAEYLLTTKLFCGYCKEMMVGVSGTSRNGSLHWYYSCKSVLGKKGCKKKNVRKEYIEQLVLEKAKQQLTDENIEIICEEVAKLYTNENENPVLRRLAKLIEESNKSIENLMRVLEKGDISDLIVERISQNQRQRQKLKAEYAAEKMRDMPLSKMEIKFFLNQLKNGCIDNIKYRRALISVFIDSIYLYDDKLTIIFHASDQAVSIDYSLVDDFVKENGSYVIGSAQPSPTK